MHRAPVKRRDAELRRRFLQERLPPWHRRGAPPGSTSTNWEAKGGSPWGHNVSPVHPILLKRALAGEGLLHMDAPSCMCPSWTRNHSLHPPNVPHCTKDPP